MPLASHSVIALNVSSMAIEQADPIDGSADHRPAMPGTVPRLQMPGQGEGSTANAEKRRCAISRVARFSFRKGVVTNSTASALSTT